MFMINADQGWAGYYDEQENMAALGFLGDLAYTPDLSPVETNGDQTTYYPRDTSQDAAALNYLGYLADAALASHVGTTGSLAGDQQAAAGAWDPAFQAALVNFQKDAGVTADGWIGPQSRQALANAVTAKNGRSSPIQPPNVIPPAVVPVGPAQPGLPPIPNPQVQPAQPGGGGTQPAAAKSNTLLYAGAAVAAVGIGYLIWKKRRGH